MTTISFTVNDEDLEGFLEEQENRSETIREALRLYQWKQECVDDPRLSDRQRAAYEWMLEQTDGGGYLPLDVARTVLAQLLSLNKDIIKHLIFRKLRQCGYIEVQPSLYRVMIRVRPPSAVDYQPESDDESGESAEEQGPVVDDPEKAGERLEEVAEATPAHE